MSSDRSLYLGDDPLRDDRDVPARCPDVARPDAPDAPSSGTRSGDRSWKHATVFPPMHRTGEVGPVLSVRAPIVLEPTRRRTCRAVELWSSPSRGVKTLDRVFCYTKSGSAAVSTWNAHADLQKSQIPRKLDTKTAQQTVTPPARRLQRGPDKNPMMSSLCHHHRKRKKRGPPKPTEERVITSRTAPVPHIILARSLARLHTSVTNMVKLHVTYCGG